MSLNNATILDIPFSGNSQEEVLGKILDFEAVSKPKKPLIVFTPNPEFLVEAQKNFEFKEILQKADLNLPDGVGLVLAAKILGKQIGQRFSGADLTEKLLSIGNEKKWTVGIVRARRGDEKEKKEQIKILSGRYPFIKFYDLDNFAFCQPRLNRVETSLLPFDLVLACHGMVKQEKWIMDNEAAKKEKITAKVFVGIGGSLDFLTGFSYRAPRWMRVIGLEWLWRGLRRPKHFKRIWKAIFVFGWLVMKERLEVSIKK